MAALVAAILFLTEVWIVEERPIQSIVDEIRRVKKNAAKVW